jgi:acyl transferase domain-containing protein
MTWGDQFIGLFVSGSVALFLEQAISVQESKAYMQYENRVHGVIKASEVNSDGRTNGISLPSAEGQERLIRRVYEQSGIAAENLAFVEAHGTGTPAGDPIEALALGRALGQARSDALPIGSLKTNIGHLEAASGLAGLIKATLALKNGVLPASLHYSAPNPNIDFDALNLKVCREPLPFDRTAWPAPA